MDRSARRGVSTYVATIVMTMVVLGAGVIVFIYSHSIVDPYSRAIAERARELERGLSATVLASYIAPLGRADSHRLHWF